MRNFVASVIQIAAPLSVATVVFSQGLGTSPALVIACFKERPRLILRALFAAIVLVPTAALALISILNPAPAVAIGLAILVSCPPAPLMIATAPRKGHADPALLASLHLSLALLGLLTVPAVLSVFSWAFSFRADVHLGTMASILAQTILIPIALGLATRAINPAFADRVKPVLGTAGNVAVAVLLFALLGAFYPTLFGLAGWSYLVLAVVSAVGLAIGHFAGPHNSRAQTALAIECGSRHPGLAIAIGTANFGAERTLPVVIPCVLTSIVIAMLYLVWRSRTVSITDQV